MTPETWATLIILVALLITILVIATRRDVAYGLVVVWALTGIAAGQSRNQDLVTLAQASAVIVLIALATTTLLTKLRR